MLNRQRGVYFFSSHDKRLQRVPRVTMGPNENPEISRSPALACQHQRDHRLHTLFERWRVRCRIIEYVGATSLKLLNGASSSHFKLVHMNSSLTVLFN